MYELALSLRPGAYLSHASAVFLHGLSDQLPKTIYVNKEQSPKPHPSSELTQEGIDRAFRSTQRASRYVLTYEGYRFVLLSGKWTNRLEVSEIAGPQGERVAATKLERTLIDIAVRPAYAGGVFEVAKAYRAARERASVGTVIATLKSLDYVYPYHQAIGFYMERAGYEGAKLDRLRALGVNFDFYLGHRMGPTSFSREWRVHYPEGL
jgi:predicted transcriptional regulator of viral defense system